MKITMNILKWKTGKKQSPGYILSQFVLLGFPKNAWITVKLSKLWDHRDMHTIFVNESYTAAYMRLPEDLEILNFFLPFWKKRNDLLPENDLAGEILWHIFLTLSTQDSEYLVGF